MKKFTSNLKICLLLAAMVVGVNSVWGNVTTYSGTGMNTNGTWGLNHATVSISRGSYSSGNKDWIVASLRNKNTASATISWTPNSGCTIKVTKVSLKMTGYGTGSQVKAKLNSSSYVDIGNLVGSTTEISTTNANGLGNSVVLDVTCSASIARDIRIQSMSITYVITPSAPNCTDASQERTLEVTTDVGSPIVLDLSSLSSYFSVNDPDFSLGYVAVPQNGETGGRVVGNTFYSTSVGDFVIKARVTEKANCHQKSDSSATGVLVHVWGRETAQFTTRVNGDESESVRVPVNSIVPFEFFTSNTELDRSTITITQKSGSTIMTCNADDQTLTTFEYVGSATFVLSQSGSEHFDAPANKTITITTFVPNNYLPLSLTEGNFYDYKHSAHGSVNWNKAEGLYRQVGVSCGDMVGGGFDYGDKYIDLSFIGVPKTLSFDYVTPVGIATDVEWYASCSVDGNSWEDLEHWNTRNGSKSYTLSPNVRFVRLAYSGNFGGVFQNVQITRRCEIDVDDYDFGSSYTRVDEKTTRSIPFKWYDVEPLTVTSDNPLFVVEVATIMSSQDHYDESATISISYLHNENNLDGGDAATITVSNGSYSESFEVTGKSAKVDQSIIWNNVGPLSSPEDEIELDAVASSGLPVVYSFASPTDLAAISGNTLIIYGSGDVNILAYQSGNGVYNEISSPQMFTLEKSAPEVYVFTTDGEWGTDANWENGNKPISADADVVIAADVVINGEVTVNSLTINEGVQVTVEVTGKLTVGDGDSDDQAAYGDLYVHNNGEVVLNNGKVNVNNFYIESAPTAVNQTAASGQLENAEKLQFANAYIDITLAPAGVFDASQWYGFAVPFPVSVSDGVFQFNEGVASKATDGVDYMIYYYDGMKRYNTGKGWTRMTSGVLNPGEFYYLTVNEGHNVMRFQKTASGALISDDTKTIVSYGDATVKPADANWNAMGNPMLQHQNATGVAHVQIYVNGESRYETVSTADHSFVVGSPFFVQAASGTLDFSDASHAAFYAPGRATVEDKSLAVELLGANEKVCDRIYMAAGEKDAEGYVLGTDLQKAGVTTRVAQMWIDRYGLKLCVNKEEAISDETEFPVVFSAPAAGEYILRATDAATDYSLYLLHNGNVVWDLTSSDYSMDLQKGTTTGYSIVMQRHVPGVATGMDAVSEKSGVEKVLVNGELFIINQNAVYSAAGKRVK